MGITTDNRRIALAAAGTALWLLATTAANAQAAPANEAPMPGPATEAPGAAVPDPGEIVVTARRRTERLLDVPVAATAVSAAEIRQFDVTNLSNIKFAAPQLFIDKGGTGSGASISLRGVSSSNLDAGLEQSILIDYDGMPTSRGRLVSDALFDIDTLDVLKGPQALFFGKNSPGGVISIKSADPTDRFEGYLRAGYEFTQDMWSGEGAISGPIGQGLSARLALYGSTSKGYIDNPDDGAGVTDPFRTARLPTYTGGTIDQPGKSRYGAEKKIAGRLTLKYDDGGPFDANFKLLLSRFTSDGIQSLAEVMACPAGQTQPFTSGHADPYGDCSLNDRQALGLPPKAVLDSWPDVAKYNGGKPYTRNNTILPTLTLNEKLDHITLTSITSLMHYSFVNQGNADKTSYGFYFSNNNEKDTNFIQEVRAITSFDGMLNFAAGGYYSRESRGFINGTANVVAPDPRNGALYNFQEYIDNHSHAFSLFGQAIFKPMPQLELAGGARYTKETRTVALQNTFVNQTVANLYLPEGKVLNGRRSEDNVSPEATITYHASRDLMFYAAYKTGYLSGGFSNPGNLTAAFTVAKDLYAEEKARGFEGGTKFSLFDHVLSGSLIGYHYTYKGLQLTSIDLTTTPPVIRTQNAATSISQGVELELNYRPMPGLALRGTSAYNDAHFKSFAGAQCYALQTAALGCVSGSQDLSGRPIYRAPRWIMTAGAIYDFDLGGGYRVTLNADMRYTSKYYVSLNLNPLSLQGSYTIVNGGARLTLPGDRLSFAVIGRNLANKHYAVLGNDKTAGIGEVTATAGEPRAVVLQVETRF